MKIALGGIKVEIDESDRLQDDVMSLSCDE